jgi:hypothetical protein
MHHPGAATLAKTTPARECLNDPGPQFHVAIMPSGPVKTVWKTLRIGNDVDSPGQVDRGRDIPLRTIKSRQRSVVERRHFLFQICHGQPIEHSRRFIQSVQLDERGGSQIRYIAQDRNSSPHILAPNFFQYGTVRVRFSDTCLQQRGYETSYVGSFCVRYRHTFHRNVICAPPPFGQATGSSRGPGAENWKPKESRARDWLIGLVESDHYVEDVSAA